MSITFYPKKKSPIRIAFLGGTAFLAVMTSLSNSALAFTDATWSTTPGDGDFGTASNWDPATVPSGIATFGASTTTSISLLGTFTVGTFQFSAGAPQYSFTHSGGTLSFNGLGIVNNSSNAPQLQSLSGSINFYNNSTAGNAVIALSSLTDLTFWDDSSAGSSTISNNDFINFKGSSTADDANIINNSFLNFFGFSNAGNAAITNNAGGVFDMSQLSNSGMAAGSIAGGGFFRLGSKQLTVGSNNLSTTVSGVITDGGAGGGTGGSLVKVGSGTLTLAGANTYTGATSINAGALIVSGSIGSSVSPSGAINVANGAALNVTSTGSIDILGNNLFNSGEVTNAGGFSGNVNFNTGVIYNNISWLGNVSSNSGAIYNNGLWDGNITNNVGGSFINGFNIVTGYLNNSGTVWNHGLIEDGATNYASGVLITDVELGGLNNFGRVFAQNLISGQINNYDYGYIELTGDLRVYPPGVNNTFNGLVNLRSHDLSTPIFDNSGTIISSNGSITGYLNNAGVIDLQTGSRISNTLTINGEFHASAGNTGLVKVDTQFGGIGAVSDRLIVNGNATGGATAVQLRDKSPSLGAWNPLGTTVVSISGANAGGGFYLDPSSPGFFGGVIEKGLYTYVFGQGPGVGCQGAVCYSIYSAPSAAAMRLPIAVTAAQDIFQNTALMWEDRQTELRDQVLRGSVTAPGAGLPSQTGVAVAPGATASKSGISLWAKSIGAWTSRSDYQVAFAGPYALGRDLGYNQSTWGILGGANGAIGTILGGEVNLGVLGGYLQSSVNFNQGSNNSRYQGGTVGASASYINRGFFVDGLFKADLLSLQMGLPWSNGGYANGSSAVNTVGGVWNAGYHYTWGQFFIEPEATLTYSATSIGALNQLAPLGAYIRYGNGSDFRGGFGGRVGTEMANIVNGHVLQASVTGRVWDQFDSNGGRTVDIVSGGIGQTIGDYTLGAVYGEVKGNIALMPIAAGWSTYVSGGAKFNNQFTTWTARGGVGYSW